MKLRRVCLSLVCAVLSWGCEPADPPIAPRSDAPRTAAPSATSRASVSASAAVSAGASHEPVDAGPPELLDAGALAAPPLLGPDGGILPQTKDEPSIDDAVFQRRLSGLWDAIVNGDVEPGRELFFPVEAYVQVKGIDKPERDWQHRLYKAYRRDVREYHQLLGKRRAEARLVRLELRNKPKWMKPGSEGNLIGYWRVTRSHLHYLDARGKKRRFDVTSMISWRGQWYVVHLHGFK